VIPPGLVDCSLDRKDHNLGFVLFLWTDEAHLRFPRKSGQKLSPHASRGEDWVKFGAGPIGSRRFVKKGRAAQAAPAPAAPTQAVSSGLFEKRSWVPTTPKPAEPAAPLAPHLQELLDEMSASRPWVPKMKPAAPADDAVSPQIQSVLDEMDARRPWVPKLKK
jgi:hypothetical protein